MANSKSKTQYSTFEFEWDYPNAFRVFDVDTSGYRTHLHRNTEIYFVRQGASCVHINDHEYDLHEGQGVIVANMLQHSYVVQNDTFVVFALLGSSLMQFFTDQYPNCTLPEYLPDAQKNKPIIQLLRSIAPQRDKFDLFEKNGYSNLLFHMIVDAYGTEPIRKSDSPKSVFASIVQYIYDHYNENLSLDVLAKQFNYAPRSIGHMFNKFLNMDIRNFINSVRVEKVLALKNDPAYKHANVIDIALACGFNCAPSYYRACKKLSLHDD